MSSCLFCGNLSCICNLSHIRFIQANLNHASAAQSLLERNIISHGIDIALISEPYNHNNLVIVDIGGLILISCYFPPNERLSDLESRLAYLKNIIQGYNKLPIIIGGDINASHTKWSCIRPQGSSIVDVTAANVFAASLFRCWKVEDIETLSDHRCHKLPAQSWWNDEIASCHRRCTASRRSLQHLNTT